MSLCLLSQNYYEAVEIVHRLADLDITVASLTEIDHLVQLLESPIFACIICNIQKCFSLLDYLLDYMI